MIINGKSLHEYIEEQKTKGDFVEFMGGSTVNNIFNGGKMVTIIDNGVVNIYRKGKRHHLQGNRIEQMGNDWYVDGKLFTFDEEDDDYYDAIIAKLEVTQEDAALTNNQMEFLKSLKDRYTWKPSDEQMEVLPKYAEHNNYDGSVLTALYQELKKLKGE